MFGKKSGQYYELNTRQYEEMQSFYRKLGYSPEQTAKLCKSCFGADIVFNEKGYYSPGWRFARRYNFDRDDGMMRKMNIGFPSPLFGGVKPLMSTSMRMSSYEASPMDGAFAPMPSASMAAPVMGMAAPGGAIAPAQAPQPPVFSTAETHDVPENELHSPLDSPQLIFSANVNTASWTYLRSRILTGKYIDKSFVRIEEIINSYTFDLPLPNDGGLFSVTAELGKCPWNDDSELMFLGIKGKKADESVRQNLAFLVDVSGSMEDQWVLVQMSMAAIVSKLKAGDTLSVIAYSDNTVTVAKNIECGDLDKVIDVILSIDGIGGCTNGSEGLENAYSYLTENFGEDKNNRVFIFTDGDFNFGVTSEGGLRELICSKRSTGIYLSIVGYGEQNFKDDKMETLARNGNGNYTFVSNPGDITEMLWDKLVSNLVTVAKDVKISVELNPAYVSDYRLIGYDFRTLTQQEFHDTEKAVDGIGSEHNTAALIEFKRGEAKESYPSRYVKSSAADKSDEFAFVEVHYKSPDGEDLVYTKAITVDELKNAYQINIDMAAVLAAFGLIVKDSDYKGKADKKLLAQLLSELPETIDPYDHYCVIKKYLENK